LTIADWEEAAHRYNLSRCQFLDGIVVDLVRLIENCCSEERIYRQYYNRLSWLAAESGIKIPVLQTMNYFMYYFHENEVNQDDREKLQSLQEKLLMECKERADLIETFLGNLILTVFDRGHYISGKALIGRMLHGRLCPDFQTITLYGSLKPQQLLTRSYLFKKVNGLMERGKNIQQRRYIGPKKPYTKAGLRML
jgi:hypothetical protein